MNGGNTTVVNISLDRIRKRHREAFDKAMAELAKDEHTEITATKWVNSRGEQVDIVDTGALRDSARVHVEETYTGFHGRIERLLPYARFVHEGVRYRNGTVMPGRPWTRIPLSKFKQNYIKNLRWF